MMTFLKTVVYHGTLLLYITKEFFTSNEVSEKMLFFNYERSR